MLTLTCLMLAVLEGRAIWLLLHDYSEHGELDEFITRAPLDKVLRFRAHFLSMWVMVQLATMMRLT